MYNELINLLPPKRQRELARDYSIRLSVVVIWFVTVLTCMAAVLLVPTFVSLTGSVNAAKARLANVESTLSSSEERVLLDRLTALSGDTATLVALASTPSVSDIIRAALAVSHPGIALSSFTYASAVNKTQSTLSISGTAATRNALRAYQLALESAPFALSAALPVSAYAKDTDSMFTILVTLAP